MEGSSTYDKLKNFSEKTAEEKDTIIGGVLSGIKELLQEVQKDNTLLSNVSLYGADKLEGAEIKALLSGNEEALAASAVDELEKYIDTQLAKLSQGTGRAR